MNTISFSKGSWVKISVESPPSNKVVYTKTGAGVFGVHYFDEGEFFSLMPTFMGEPASWYKNHDGSAESYLSEELPKEPELDHIC